MPIQISYMGTKRQLAPMIAEIVRKSSPGPLLDLFSGICAVSSAVGPLRHIWCNDAQLFASTVARAFFTFSDPPIPHEEVVELIRPHFLENQSALTLRFIQSVSAEHDALGSNHLQSIQELEDQTPSVLNNDALERERRQLMEAPTLPPYRLFSITYAGGYLGLHQCIEVDSLRYAFDQLAQRNHLTNDQHAWMCLALCQALSKCATTTGHFAQYLRVKEKTKKRFLAQRRRRIWQEWLSALSSLAPLGHKEWRLKNKGFHGDALDLLQELTDKNIRPAVIYADPPYTDDQYSRYYHVYETLLLYDYPAIQSTGRYRPDRFSSPFSLKTKVRHAVETMISCCAELKCDLILTYPETGLLPDSKRTILSLLRGHYGGNVSTVALEHQHSSLGGSKGYQNLTVNEIIYVAAQS